MAQPMARSGLTGSKARRDRAIGAIGATPILLLLYIIIVIYSKTSLARTGLKSKRKVRYIYLLAMSTQSVVLVCFMAAN